MNSPKLNIVFVLTRSDTVGGVQNHVVEIAAALNDQGHIATVVCGGNGQYFEKLEQYGVPHHALESLSNELSLIKDRRALGDLVELLHRIKPDIVSTHSTKAGLIGRLACSKLNIPVLFTAHGWAFTDGVGGLKQFAYSRLERWLATKTKKVICVSHYDKQLAIDARIPESKLCTIHNGRHDDSTRYDAREFIRAADDVPVIVMIGRLDKQKDHPTLFSALERLRHTEKFKLVLLGDGPKLKEYQSLATELGIAEFIEFKGLVKNVHQELRGADIFALVTHYEGFPRSTLEAMCAGLPVVVSDAGGSAEAVEIGVNGYVVEREDVEGLVTVLRELLGNEKMRREMGERSRAMFVEHFTFDRMYEQTMQIYADVLSAKQLKQ